MSPLATVAGRAQGAPRLVDEVVGDSIRRGPGLDAHQVAQDSPTE